MRVFPVTADRVRLASGSLVLEIAPLVGGSIARFDFLSGVEKTSIFRGCDDVLQSPLEAASFPLVPYCNRIRDGRFSFRGRDIVIPRNMESDPSPLHGHGWLGAWDVVSAGPKEAELVYRHDSGDWPWSYEARQLFRLDGNGLSLELVCRNLSDMPMPCGLGQHPYYPCTSQTRLDTHVTHAWTIDGKVLPLEKVPATGRYDLRDRRVCAQDLDNGFAGWGGTARMQTPGDPFRIEMHSADADFFQLYSPASGGLYVAEPVSHANAALNEPEESWPELGLRVLHPGEEMRLATRWSVIAA
jgi:aldose 1-epimerase